VLPQTWQFPRQVPWHLEVSVHSSPRLIVSPLLHRPQPIQVKEEISQLQKSLNPWWLNQWMS
jgi:hypothetical protein